MEKGKEKVGELIELDDLIGNLSTNTSEGDYCLGGTLCREKFWNPTIVGAVMSTAWDAKRGLEVTEWGEKKLLFRFRDKADRDKVLRNQSWHFEGALFAIKELTGMEQPSSVLIDRAALWLRVYDIPPACMNERVAHILSKQIGMLDRMDNIAESCFGKFIRMKVWIDITKPLIRGLTIKLRGEVIWLPVKYEAMPTYCFCCGMLGHVVKNCSKYDRNECPDIAELSFGPRLKASPLRRYRAGNEAADPKKHATRILFNSEDRRREGRWLEKNGNKSDVESEDGKGEGELRVQKASDKDTEKLLAAVDKSFAEKSDLSGDTQKIPYKPIPHGSPTPRKENTNVLKPKSPSFKKKIFSPKKPNPFQFPISQKLANQSPKNHRLDKRLSPNKPQKTKNQAHTSPEPHMKTLNAHFDLTPLAVLQTLATEVPNLPHPGQNHQLPNPGTTNKAKWNRMKKNAHQSSNIQNAKLGKQRAENLIDESDEEGNEGQLMKRSRKEMGVFSDLNDISAEIAEVQSCRDQ